MPHAHTTPCTTELPKIPVAVLLPPLGRRRAAPAEPGDLPDWYGVAPREVAGLTARYSKPGDLVIELDAHPTIVGAVRHLGRRTAVVPRGDDGAVLSAGASLIFAALPCPGFEPGDLNAISIAIRTWQSGLRSGGYLLTALNPPGPDRGDTPRPVSLRASVIAAARVAGLIWQQEFLVLTASLPADEPRARSDTPKVIPAALIDGRHRPVHVKVLAFRHESGDSHE